MNGSPTCTFGRFPVLVPPVKTRLKPWSGAMNSIASGFRTDINYGIADASRTSVKDFVVAENA